MKNLIMNNSIVVKANSISHTYITKNKSTEVIRDLSFTAKEDEFITFVGPSGCGKSTLFNIISGLMTPTNGSIYVEGQESTGSPHKSVGYMLQKDLLLPWRTLFNNVILGLEVRNEYNSEVELRAKAMFKEYNLAGYENHYPNELSGGMRQRAALMRTLLLDPKVLLMDEAYKALDYPLKVALESKLLETVRRLKKTVIFITHDIEEAVTLSDRVYVMKAHPGRITDEININLGIDSPNIRDRHASESFNYYYQRIWDSITENVFV